MNIFPSKKPTIQYDVCAVMLDTKQGQALACYYVCSMYQYCVATAIVMASQDYTHIVSININVNDVTIFSESIS